MNTRAILLFSVIVSLPRSGVNAQCPGCATDFTCVVSPPYPALCPPQPPDATAGQSYTTDITFWMPANFDDPGTGYNLDFDQMTVTGINGLPFGLQIETSNASGIYYPQIDQYGCARICGTPLGAGTYTVTIDIIATVTVTAFGFQVNAPQSFPITLVVLPGSGGNASFSFTPTSGCGGAEVEFEALIDGAGQPTSYAWDFGNGNTGSDMVPPPQEFPSPGIYTVSLTTTIGGYVLNTVNLNGVNDNWCGDVEEPYLFGCTLAPDLYFILTNGSGGQYTSSSGSDSETESWTSLGLLLDDPPYSMQFLDEDPISADDDLGTYNIPLGGAGNYPFVVAGGTNGELIIDLTTQLTFTDSDTITVFPSPSIATAFDTATSEICATDTTAIGWTWFHDGDTVPGEFGPCITADSAGLWWAMGTNGYGCVGGTDTITICPNVLIQDGGSVLYVLGDFAAYSWSYNGAPITGAIGPVLVPDLPGNYSILVTTSYGCVVSDTLAWLTTGVVAQRATSIALVFPSPNRGAFSLVADGLKGAGAMVTIADDAGRVVFNQSCAITVGSIAKRFDLLLSPGTFTLRIEAEGMPRMVRFAVSH